MNPRYLNYCRQNGNSPEEQMRLDGIAYPGGIMAGFLIWSSARIAEACKEIPGAFLGGRLTDHTLYDKWLTRRTDELTTLTKKSA